MLPYILTFSCDKIGRVRTLKTSWLWGSVFFPPSSCTILMLENLPTRPVPYSWVSVADELQPTFQYTICMSNLLQLTLQGSNLWLKNHQLRTLQTQKSIIPWRVSWVIIFQSHLGDSAVPNQYWPHKDWVGRWQGTSNAPGNLSWWVVFQGLYVPLGGWY